MINRSIGPNLVGRSSSVADSSGSSGSVGFFSAFQALLCTAQQFRHCTTVQTLPGFSQQSWSRHCSAVQTLPGISQQSWFRHCSAVQAQLRRPAYCPGTIRTSQNLDSETDQQFDYCTAVQALSCSSQQFRHSGCQALSGSA